MPWIYLDATTENNTYSGNAYVSDKIYEHSNLFKRYEHKPKNRIVAEDIKVYKNYNHAFSKFATLKPGNGSYRNATVYQADVYYNVYDNEHKYPLLLVISFSGKNVKNRYYKRSEFDTEIDQKTIKNIDKLTEYKGKEDNKQLLELLIEENRNLKEFLTYEIDKKPVSDNGDGTKYNNNKIIVKKLVDNKNVEEHLKGLLTLLTSKKFTIHRHDPEQGFGQKHSCFIYNNHPPFGDNGKPILEFQNKKYNVSVYYSDSVDIPLLLEFNQGGHSYDPSKNNLYYYHKKKDDNSMYWEKIKDGHVLNLFFVNYLTIFQQLTESQNKKFIQILTTLEIDLRRKLYIIVDNKNGYSKNNIAETFSESNKHRLINSEVSIGVSDNTSVSGKCFTGTNFNVYVHDFTNLVASVQRTEKVVLKFIIPNNENKYNELKLYESYSFEGNEANLFYNIDQKKLYVFFYGSEDPRPLLLCYNGTAYAPKNKNTYFNRWFRSENIRNCTCQGDSGLPKLDSNDKPLLNALSTVIKLLNETSLNKRPSNMSQKEPNKYGSEEISYDVQSYNGEAIQVKVTYENKTCYRVYTHTPKGIKGDGNNYRLGNIKHGDDDISYSSHLPLSSVSVYYSVHDGQHKNPLLVSLEFKSNGASTYEYYKPIKKGGKEWVLMSDSDIIDKLKDKEKIEEGLYDLRKELDIKFENKDDSTALFKIEKCEEDKTSVAAVASGTVGTLALTGGSTGLAIYKYSDSLLSLLSKVFSKVV